MAERSGRFCTPSETTWTWWFFFQAPEKGQWKPVSYTYVEYPAGDIIGKALAWCSLTPIFLIVSFLTLIVFRRELHTIAFFCGILLNEIINLSVKYTLKHPRPCRKSENDTHSVVYGMPSSHAQFMGFFASYMVFFAYMRLPVQSDTALENICKHIIACGSIISALIVAYSRVYLRYHTVEQIFVGLLVGICLGFSWFMVTEHILTPMFPSIVSWPISEMLLIRDSTAIPNILWFEYRASRMEASLSLTSPMQGAVAMAYSILDFVGQVVRPDKLKDDSKNVNGQINTTPEKAFQEN